MSEAEVSIDVVLDLPNVIARRRMSEPQKIYVIDDLIKPFVLAVARGHPEWQFIGTTAFTTNSEVSLQRFAIWEGRELLGRLGVAWRKHGSVYTVHNERIKATRKRGDCAVTGDLQKAVKLVNKMVSRKSMAELIDEASGLAAGMAAATLQSRTIQCMEASTQFMQGITPYLMENLEQFIPIAVEHGADKNLMDALPSRIEAAEVMGALQREVYVCAGYTVITKGADYLVSTGSGAKRRIVCHTTDTLPEHIKRKLGILKLTDNKTVLPEHGMRMRDDMFYIVGEQHGR